ncbi:MAG TPA: hypothetical protein VN847_21925 [Streptosporangiaceae bacterium]|nr:hypothetical protein [Streptosporangiaceae bacterium]
MNRDRAERHLRLAAEAALRRARALSDDRAGPSSSAVFTDCVLRLNSVAMALTTVGALEAGRADDILIQFQAALAARRRLQPQTAGPLLRRGPRRMAGAVAASLPRPGESPTPPPPWRLWPVGRMLPFRTEYVAGELYVLSLLVTAHRAHALIFASTRPAIPGGVPFTGFSEPFTQITATDDRGTAYQVNFRGGGSGTQWRGQLTTDPAPPAGARWLELAAGEGMPPLRIDLTSPPPAAEVTVRPQDSQPGEQLLEHAAQQILASAERPGDARRQAYGLGDVIAALEAAGALSPFSPVPGYLAMICERLGIEDHGITAAPTASLPGPWLSMLAWYGRRHRPPTRDGAAAMGTVLPDVDRARVALGGLHTRDNRTFLHLVVAPQAAAGPLVDAGPFSHPGFSCWLRDETRQWHAAVPESWHGEGDGEVSGTMQVLPPLGRDCSRLTLLASTLTGRVRAEVPLRWWAAP